jgi:hypothetical protein
MDPDTQEQLLDSFKWNADKSDHDRKSDRKRDRVPGGDPDGKLRAPELMRLKTVAASGKADKLQRCSALKSVSQIVPSSSIGWKKIRRRLSRWRSDSDDDSSDSDDDSSDVSDSIGQSCRDPSKKGSKKHRKHKRSSIKPIPPKEYDGSPNLCHYHRFILEGKAYVKDGKVQRKRQIHVVAHFLTGKAYDFYMQKVASHLNTEDLDTHKFFSEMFNYCFPLDYKQQMRIKLENLCQGPNQTVSEYVYDLQELFDLTGNTPPNLQVIKLWYSLWPKIQRTMWKDGLHPDESSWEEVAIAEMVEIADSIIDYWEHWNLLNYVWNGLQVRGVLCPEWYYVRGSTLLSYTVRRQSGRERLQCSRLIPF